jgi:DNA-3-methyladenine glycosylase II
MFQLRRLDVWPTGDLGVRRGYGLAWKIPMPSAGELQPDGMPHGRHHPSPRGHGMSFEIVVSSSWPSSGRVALGQTISGGSTLAEVFAR